MSSTVSITDIAYGDDIALLGDSFEAVQGALAVVERYAAAEEVATFKCLGTSFTATGQAVQEIESQINAARMAFNRLQHSLWSCPFTLRELSRHP